MKEKKNNKKTAEFAIPLSFTWAHSCRKFSSFVPCFDIGWEILFENNSTVSENIAERKKFEKFVYDFFDVKTGSRQIIFNWSTNNLKFIVSSSDSFL